MDDACRLEVENRRLGIPVSSEHSDDHELHGLNLCGLLAHVQLGHVGLQENMHQAHVLRSYWVSNFSIIAVLKKVFLGL